MNQPLITNFLAAHSRNRTNNCTIEGNPPAEYVRVHAQVMRDGQDSKDSVHWMYVFDDHERRIYRTQKRNRKDS
jgi:hypothetical protein